MSKQKTKPASRAERARGRGGPGEAPTSPAAELFFPAALVLGTYFLLSLLFFLPALMPGTMIFGTDHLAGAYFYEKFASDRLAAWALPKWLPYVFGGVPFFSNPMDTYYPLTILLRLLQSPTHHLPLFIFIVQLFVAGAGMYLLVRELGGRAAAAALAGLLFMFSGLIVSFIYAGHDGRMIVATLSPLFFFALHRAVRTPEPRWFVLAGVVLGCANLSNQIQSTYYLLLGGGLWVAFLFWHLEVVRPARAVLARLAGGLATLVIGFAMVAVNYLPFLSYVPHSPRADGRGYEYATSWAMAPEEIVGLAVPEHIGILQAYFGQNPFKLHTEYVGALALLLAAAALYLLWRSRYTWFFAALGVFTLTIAFGGHTPIYRLYYEVLPGTSMFRAPSISFYLFVLSLVTLAGLGFERLAVLRDELRSRAPEARARARAVANRLGYGALAALGAVLVWALVTTATPPTPPAGPPATAEALRAMQAAANHPDYVQGIWRFGLFLLLSAGGLWLWLRGTLATRVAAVALAVVAVVDLWIIDKKFFETVPRPEVTFAPDEVADFLRAQPGPFRTFVLFDLPQDSYLTLFGLELVGGEHGNQLHSYNEFLGAGEQVYTDYHNMGDPRFLALANARYLVTTQPLEAPMLEPVFRGRVRDGRTATVYENTQVLPRAFLVPSARRVAEPTGAVEAMRAPDFDPAAEVLLYETPPLEANGSALAGGEARIRSHEPDEVVVDVASPDSAYLVLLDNYYPDWTATVNGEAAPVLRANHTFRAVVVPPGEHVVRFGFVPRSLRVGSIITLVSYLALIGFGLVLAAGWWRRRRPATAPA